MPSYFEDQSSKLSLPLAVSDGLGLRSAQRAAIYSIAAHFARSEEPALVSMPTGSGKTAILMLTAFVLMAKRALVLTPSVLVRSQIAERFESLSTLRKIRVAPDSIEEGPKTTEVTGKLGDTDAWDALRAYDVVVGIPNSLSPAAKGVHAPPPDLFDLILVDEAHHGRARTWEALISAFPDARQVHFTATPFRRDRQELKGRFVYTYSLSEAYEDRVFGEIIYEPVEPEGENADVAVAKAAEAVVARDRDYGFNHLLMVRTDSRKRADELKGVYAEHTALDLRLIHSGLKPRTVKRSIAQLRSGRLDGVICVDMLGEGFDLPELKVAAVHVPHGSLAVTLQFIGRFARTEADDPLGAATFVAVPSQIEVERQRLYDESDAWQRIVTNLSEGRIRREVEAREQLATFERVGNVSPDLRDVSPGAFRPLKHVKVYRVTRPADEIDITAPVEMPAPLEVVERWDSPDLQTAVFVTQERKRPEWTSLPQFDRIEYDLFAVYHDRESNLLFINASRRTTPLYERVAKAFTDGDHRILPLSHISRVLATLSDFQFFNVGMRRQALHPNADSYQIRAGRNPQNSVSPTDGRMYNRGHVSGVATRQNGEKEYFGYSSSSKVWSVETDLIPGIVGWSRTLAHRIQNYNHVTTGSGIDHLGVGEELDAFPDSVFAVDWPFDAYRSFRRVRDSETGDEIPLLDFDIEVVRAETAGGVVRLSISNGTFSVGLNYEIGAMGPLISSVDTERDLVVISGRNEVAFAEYFNCNPPPLFLADFSRIDNGQLFRTAGDLAPFSLDYFRTDEWIANGVDIRREFGDSDRGISIHDHLTSAIQHDVVFYDHGSGEMADFVTFRSESDVLVISFFHCKGSGGDNPGSRVGDAYEVACQVVKSLVWLRGVSEVVDRINERDRSREGSRFVKGTREDLRAISGDVSGGLAYEMILVQPGLSKRALNENVGLVLAAADRFIQQSHNCNPLILWGSA